MKEIDHNPNERRETNGIWWLLGLGLAFNWAVYFYFRDFDWWSVAMGGASGLILATWAIEITGNKIPDSWRGKPPRT